MCTYPFESFFLQKYYTFLFCKWSIGNRSYLETLLDVYQYNDAGAVVGEYGLIGSSSGQYSFDRAYFGHTYPYYSVDGYKDLVVAVGKNTIATNMKTDPESQWNEVYDRNLNGFNHTFYRIRFKNENTFYVSGENGLLWRAKI